MIEVEEMMNAKAEMAKTDMRRIRELIEEVQLTTKEIAQHEDDLSDLKEDLRKITEEELPAAMQEVGMDTFGAPEFGVDVELENKIDCKIPGKNEDEAYAWLQDNGHGSLIKSILQVSFDKGEIDKVEGIVEAARAAGLSTEGKRSIHASTLKSFVKSMLEDGKELPLDLFGVYQRTVAKIKPRK